jgi:hypothetical protein
MIASIREPNEHDGDRVLPWTLFESPEPEQAESRETMIATAVQRPGGFVVVVLRALSAWPT